jgi:hypothetical protein
MYSINFHCYILISNVLRKEFGPCVFHENGELNRAALRTIIFEVEILYKKTGYTPYFYGFILQRII